MAAPAFAVSAAGLARPSTPRSSGAERRGRGVELQSPSLLFGRNKGTRLPRNYSRHLAHSHSLVYSVVLVLRRRVPIPYRAAILRSLLVW